jgi:tetratricopeptide (TPR) repeat protein
MKREIMKTIAALLLIAMTALAAFPETIKSSSSRSANLSPAERSIAQATRLIEKNPNNFEAYNALALALSRRARETSDVKYYSEAEEALQKSFAIARDNFDGARTHVWLLLGKHEFAAALEEAKKLNKRMPDDIMVYGFLTDANVELGNYKDAEASAQWMLDLRPGNLPGITRAAYLRELFGDTDGSLELMNMALQSTPPSQVEDAAWILTQMAHLELTRGNIAQAEPYLQQALTFFPGYHYALGNLAKVRIQQKRYPEAIQLREQRYQAAPHAENLYELAEALELGGHADDAKKAFAEFEKKSLLESVRADNSNRELIFYYADHAHEPAKALKVAQAEYARRHDVFTLDAYAWALHVNGRDNEARKHIEAALAIGIRDAKLLRHAGEIALATDDRAAAENYLKQGTELNTTESEQARALLARLTPTATNH